MNFLSPKNLFSPSQGTFWTHYMTKTTTVCPRNSEPFHVVSYYTKRVTTEKVVKTPFFSGKSEGSATRPVWTGARKGKTMTFLHRPKLVLVCSVQPRTSLITWLS